jgi:hypothetical protein
MLNPHAGNNDNKSIDANAFILALYLTRLSARSLIGACWKKTQYNPEFFPGIPRETDGRI